jgi:streptogramin lyase
MIVSVLAVMPATAVAPSRTYTLDADFDEGTLVNVVHDPSDQLQLDDTIEAFNFIWIAVSSNGTVVKINTETGAVLGEYRTTPQSHGFGNPSRTTVDKDGSVWVANRNDVYDDNGSVVHIGLEENGQCEDRNGNGVIDTSTGLGDVRSWTDTSGARGVATSADECIVHYTKVNSQGTRHVSVDASNDVWVGGLWSRNFDLVKGGRWDVPGSGNITRSENSVGYGGYGGLIDPNGVIWSANRLLRWDTALPLTGLNGDPAGNSIGPPISGRNWAGQTTPDIQDSYGLCIDSHGNVWNTQLSGNLIHKYAPNGTHLGAFAHGAGSGWAQGCVVDGDDHVWTAHSLNANRNTIGHLLNDGTFIGNVVLSDADVGPTGVAVDAAGKIWATGYRSNRAYRINPTLGPIGADGVTPIGAEDFRSVDLGGNLYDYSDMTGSTLIGAPDNGMWTVVYDSGIDGANWSTVSWNSSEPGDSSITVTAASSNDGSIFGAAESVTNGVALTVADGRYLKVSVAFTRSSSDSDGDGTNDSPILYDLTVECNQLPNVSGAYPSMDCLWPPNNKFVDLTIEGITDPDGDDVTITITNITSDEPTASIKGAGGAKHAPDADPECIGTAIARVRAERSGDEDGRVYEITFLASDGIGEPVEGTVQVKVPHDWSGDCVSVDSGQNYDATEVN